MSLTEIDHWIGRTLFVPPIIKLCHLTRQTQYAVSRLFWFAASLDGFYHARGTTGRIVWGTVCVANLIAAALRADRPTLSFLLFRMASVAFWFFNLTEGVTIGRWEGVEFWTLVLFAEYAATIRTLPPAADTKRTKLRTDVTPGR